MSKFMEEPSELLQKIKDKLLNGGVEYSEESLKEYIRERLSSEQKRVYRDQLGIKGPMALSRLLKFLEGPTLAEAFDEAITPSPKPAKPKPPVGVEAASPAKVAKKKVAKKKTSKKVVSKKSAEKKDS